MVEVAALEVTLVLVEREQLITGQMALAAVAAVAAELGLWGAEVGVLGYLGLDQMVQVVLLIEVQVDRVGKTVKLSVLQAHIQEVMVAHAEAGLGVPQRILQAQVKVGMALFALSGESTEPSRLLTAVKAKENTP